MQNKERHPFDLHKYQHILEQISTTHQFDVDLERKLNQLDDKHDSSSFLNKQYAKYIEKAPDLQLSHVNLVDPAEDVCTHKEARALINTIKGRPIKFTEFFRVLVRDYALEFDSPEQKTLFKDNLQSRIVTLDDGIVSLNALQICTRDRGIVGLIEEIAEETYTELSKKEKQKINSEIVDELENVKQLLEKKSQMQAKKEKELLDYEYSLHKFKSEMSNSIQQVYEILSKMMEEQYQQKLTTLTKKFANMEHQLKSKLKLIELKGSSIEKSNLNYSTEIQRLKQKNQLLEKQVESSKVRIMELEKKLSLEKDNSLALQKKIEKVNQKLSTKDVLTEQSEQQIQIKQEQIMRQEQQKKPQPQVETEKKQGNTDNIIKYVKPFQSMFEQLFMGLDQLQLQQGVENKKWNQELIPCSLQDNLIDLIGNMMTITINKQGFSQMYKLLLQLSYFYFKNTCTQISLQQVEEIMKNSKKTCKYFIGIHDSKNRDFIQQLRILIEKKKKNSIQLALLLMLYDRDITVALKYLTAEICNEEAQKFVLDYGLLDVFVIKTIDDKSTVQLLLEIIAQGPYQNQFLLQLSQYFEILLTMLWSSDLEFCEQLSIILQRVQYYNKQQISANLRNLIERKLICDSKFELLKQNLYNTAYGQGQVITSSSEPIIVINKSFDSFVKFEQARSETQKRMSINDPTICRLLKFTTSEQKSFCGQLFGLRLQYQYTRQCLAELKQVSEFDCMSIIRDITHALLLFIEKRIRHGYLSPQTILISQKYQLTDIRFITDMYEYKMQLIGFTNSCYLAPNLVYELGKRTLNPIYNHEKSEVFSLGLIVLELAIQQSVQSIYDLSRFFVSQDLINNYLRIAAQKYSKQMVDLLSRMLQVDEDQRIDLYQLDKLVNQKPSAVNSINVDKYVNNSTQKNAYTSQSPKPLTPTRSIFQNTYSTNNYSTIHFEKNSQPNTMTFYQQRNLDSNYQTKKPQITNYFESHHTIKRDHVQKQNLDTGDSYRDNRRVKTEYDTQEPVLHQHSESFISPARKPDHQLDQLFNQFDQNLQKVKQKIHHLRINTPTSVNQSVQHQSVQNQSYHSHFAESVDEFPTFKPSSIPNKIDVGLNNENVLRDMQHLESKIYDFSALEKPNYISNSYYDDMARDARLPDSGTIHLHSRSPASLSDFFIKK